MMDDFELVLYPFAFLFSSATKIELIEPELNCLAVRYLNHYARLTQHLLYPFLKHRKRRKGNQWICFCKYLVLFGNPVINN